MFKLTGVEILGDAGVTLRLHEQSGNTTAAMLTPQEARQLHEALAPFCAENESRCDCWSRGFNE